MKGKIARFIIEHVQENAMINGFQYIVDYSIIAKEFDITIREKEANLIREELYSCEEVSEVELNEYGFDVVLCTDFAPNYVVEDEFEMVPDEDKYPYDPYYEGDDE